MKKYFSENELIVLEAHGYSHVYSVVKSVFDTTYVNCRSIAAIRNNGGKWLPASQYNITWAGRVGITLSAMYRRYGKGKCAGHSTIRYDLPKWIDESRDSIPGNGFTI